MKLRVSDWLSESDWTAFPYPALYSLIFLHFKKIFIKFWEFSRFCLLSFCKQTCRNCWNLETNIILRKQNISEKVYWDDEETAISKAHLILSFLGAEIQLFQGIFIWKNTIKAGGSTAIWGHLLRSVPSSISGWNCWIFLFCCPFIWI